MKGSSLSLSLSLSLSVIFPTKRQKHAKETEAGTVNGKMD